MGSENTSELGRFLSGILNVILETTDPTLVNLGLSGYLAITDALMLLLPFTELTDITEEEDVRLNELVDLIVEQQG